MDTGSYMDPKSGGIHVINRDEGTYFLSHAYDQLLQVKTSNSAWDENKHLSIGSAVAGSAPSSQNIELCWRWE